MTHLTRTLVGSLTAALCAIALAGCTLAPATQTDDAPVGTNHPDDTTTETVQDTADESGNDAAEQSSSSDSSSEESTAEEDGVGAFGQAYTWEDGLSVTIDKPKAYKPSESAYVDGEGKPMSLKVTLVNGSDEAFDPTLATVSAQSGNEEASEIFDTAKNLEGAPSTKLLPGREASYTVAFSFADPDDIVVEFSPDFTHSSALYTN